MLVFTFVLVCVVTTVTAAAATTEVEEKEEHTTSRHRRAAPVVPLAHPSKAFESLVELQTAVDAFLVLVVGAPNDNDGDNNNNNNNNNNTKRRASDESLGSAIKFTVKEKEEDNFQHAQTNAIHTLEQYGTQIKDWNVSKLRNFNHVFDVDRNPLVSSPKLSQDTDDVLDLSQWDVSQATHMIGMFRGATYLNVDVSKWDTSSNQRFDNMFEHAISFQGVGLNHWNVSSGIHFHSMFQNTTSLGQGIDLTSIDLRSWDVSKAETLTNMFRHSNFGQLDAPQQQQRKQQQDFTITTITSTDDDDDGKDDFELSDDDFVLFQNDIQQFNLCGWRWKLPSSADTRGMFEQSLCPDTSDPDLTTTTTKLNTIDESTSTVTIIPATSFCVYCEEKIQILKESNNEDAPADSEFPEEDKSNDDEKEEEIKVEEIKVETQPPDSSSSSSSSSQHQQQSTQTRKRPNVLFIIADQMRFDMIRSVQEEFYDDYQAYNTNQKPFYKIQTPNLDKLKASGVYFKNTYCQCAVCGPSRTSLRTGCTIERTGIQHNDMITEFDNNQKNNQNNNNNSNYEQDNHMSFEQRVNKLTSLDQLLVEKYGYVSEYYGKWHMPKSLGTASSTSTSTSASSDNNNDIQYLNQYNDYNFETNQFFHDHDSSSSKKLREYLNYYERQTPAAANNRTISRTPIPDGMQRDTYTRAQYTPIQLDPRSQTPTDTKDFSPLIGNSKRRTQSNIMGRYGLSELYTPSYFTGLLSSRAIQRLLKTQQQEKAQQPPERNRQFLHEQKDERGQQQQPEEPKPWFLTVSFHSPHPPYVPAWKHLQKYWEHRDELFVSPSFYNQTEMENSDYKRITTQIPEYGNVTYIREWIALYYALVEEVDEWIGTILATYHKNKEDDNTLIIFTSDHGEMLGAHQKRSKNNFYEESSHVPLLMYYKGMIAPNTVVEEPVGLIDIFATIFDYVDVEETAVDTSDGRSLRPLIERNTDLYNRDYDQSVIVGEWDYRKPMSEAVNTFDRRIDDRPSFLIKKGTHKLMIQKLAQSTKMDMMFDVQHDRFEVHNLLGKEAMAITDQAIVAKAEHLRCLLLDWMLRLDGGGGGNDPGTRYFSDPANNFGEGNGDINEIRQRQRWTQIGLWVSHGNTNNINPVEKNTNKNDNPLEFGKVSWTTRGEFIRHEWFYLGTRFDETFTIISLTIAGRDGDNYFSVDEASKQELLDGKEIGMNACESIRVTFRTIAAMTEEIINSSKSGAFDASLVLELLRRDDDENAITRITVPLVLVDLDFTARPSSSSATGVDDTWSPPPISFTDNDDDDDDEDESCATSSSYRIIRVICRTWNNIMGDDNSEPSPNDGYDWSHDDDGTDDASSPSHDNDNDDDSAPSHDDDDDDSSTSHYDDDNPPYYDYDDDSRYDDDDSSPSRYDDDDSTPSHHNDDDSSSVSSFSSDDDDVMTTTSGFSEFLASLTSDTIKYAFIGGLMGIVFLFFIICYICFASGSDEREAMHLCTSYLCSRRTYQTWYKIITVYICEFFGKNANKRTYHMETYHMESESENINSASDGFYDEVDEEGVVDGTTTHIRNPWLSTELKKLENHQPHDRLDPVPPPAPPSIS